MHRDLLEPQVRSIAVSRSRFEAEVRRIIGGGEMQGWATDSRMYRGGGNSNDAVKLLLAASCEVPGNFLDQCYSVDAAREALHLPNNLAVPDYPACCECKSFNDDASAGPLFSALRRNMA